MELLKQNENNYLLILAQILSSKFIKQYDEKYFVDEVKKIFCKSTEEKSKYYQFDEFDKLPKKKFRQNLLFTATLNDDIKGIANYCLNNYYYFNSVKECPKTIKHMFYYCKGTEEKIEKLINFLKEGENIYL